MSTRKIQVFLQAITRYSKDDPGYPSSMIATGPDDWFPIENITDRIPMGTIKDLSEKMESGRFAFVANDITISDIANNDGLFFPEMVYCTAGSYLYIHYDGNEIYRGYASYIDFTFKDANPKTVDIHTYNWLNLLKEQKTTNFQMERYTLDWYQSKIDNLLDLTTARPFLTMPDKPNIEGIENIVFDAYIGTPDTQENAKTQPYVWDLWQSPITKRIFMLGVDPKGTWNDPDKISLYEVICNKFVHIADFLPGGSKTLRSRCAILRNNLSSNYVGVSFRAGQDAATTSTEHYSVEVSLVKGYPTEKGTLGGAFYTASPDVYVRNTTTAYQMAVSSSGVLYQLVRPVDGCDGHNFYNLSYDGTTGLWTATIVDTGYVSPAFAAYSKSAIYFPHEGTIVYYERPNTTWKWFRTAIGTINTGAALPTRSSYYVEYWIMSYRTGMPRPMYMLDGFLLPSGYAEDYLTGQFSTWFSDMPFYIADPEGSGDWVHAVDYGIGTVYKSSDPLFLAFSGFRYGDDEVSIEDLLMDFAQAFNCYLFTREGVLYLFERSHYADSYTFSKDYIDREGYERELSDESLEEPNLSFTTENLTDDEKHKFSKYTFCGALRIAYRDAFSVKWVKRSLAVPLPKGYACGLGDRITVTETGESGTVIERRLDFDKGMAEFKYEVKL